MKKFLKDLTKGITDDFKKKGTDAIDTSKKRTDTEMKNDDFGNLIVIETDFINAAKVGNIKGAKSYFQKYFYDANRILINDGIISSKQQILPFYKMKSVESTQSILQKQVNVGEITIYMHDNSIYKLVAVVSPHKVSETLNSIILTKINNVTPHEFI